MLRNLLMVLGLAVTMPAAAADAPQRPDAGPAWHVAQPEEIVAWYAFDPASVADRLPRRLRFVTVGELAAGNVGWAAEFLRTHVDRSAWGVSFVEIVRAGTFEIDGLAPKWPPHGAAALWFARVAPADSTDDLGPGQPWLALDFWMPDRAYAATMAARGYFARFGQVRLRRDGRGAWQGAVSADGLHVAARCTPAGPVFGAMQSGGAQVFFPPTTSGLERPVRVSFTGHRVQSCAPDARWRLSGSHPLARAMALGGVEFQFGYELRGAVDTR